MEWQSIINQVNSNFHITLGSQSPRRKYLLKEVGFDFNVEIKNIEESFPLNLKAENIPVFLSNKKAEAFLNSLQPKSLLITADTVVWINGKVLNKPENEKNAIEMLMQLSGNTHEVFTGVTLLTSTHKKTFSVRSEVTFKKSTESELLTYIQNYKPFDKAGSYGAQECLPLNYKPCSEQEIDLLKLVKKEYMNAPNLNISNEMQKSYPLIEKINGSYFNVMGLPIAETIKELKSFIE